VTIQENEVNVLGADEVADICDVLQEPYSNHPLAYAVNYERKTWHPIASIVQHDFAFLQQLDDGDLDILSQTLDNKLWLVSFIHDDGPITYYLYQRETKQAQLLFDSHHEFKKHQFVKMQPRVIPTRDGLQCVSYLSLPAEKTPVPLVLMVHGGPHYRDFWGFNPIHQWLANRGYAVLSVNYRASTGFGKKHMQAGFGEWAGKIQNDLIDAVEYAIAQKITTRSQVAIMGRSFGGYATLVALTMTPDIFCCGVDIVGPANLEAMAKHFPVYWQALEGAVHEMIGCDPNTEQGKAYLAKRSPIHHVDKITKPLLIGHGANDVRVMLAESDKVAQAMQKNNIPVTYALFPDEGHQFSRPGNRMAFYALVEAFLAKTLKGKVEPIDKKIQTSMIVKVDDFGLSN
jgi:dipeptidyl aminopeptidase/acylaminoacyl peptidase